MEEDTQKPRDYSRWMETYRMHVLENGSPPPSVFAFCRVLGIGEEEFFEAFPTLDVFESEIWAERVRHVREVLDADEEYAAYPPRQKALAFFYTFLESIRGQRSWFLARFPREFPARDPERLGRFRDVFLEWACPVAAEEVGAGKLAERLRADKGVARLLYAHFRAILKFHLEDGSDRFERTDAFVEKSVRLFFDLADTRVPESAADLLRFLSGKKK
ncbi:MAG: hypothetical protein ACLFSZ_07530 [Puniceicoccaceae bacterium]